MLRSPDLNPRQLLREVAVIRYVKDTGRPMMGVTRTKLLAAREYLREVLPGIRTPEQIAKILETLRQGQTSPSDTKTPTDLAENYKAYLYGHPEPHSRHP